MKREIETPPTLPALRAHRVTPLAAVLAFWLFLALLGMLFVLLDA